jgi:hypothetical protein
MSIVQVNISLGKEALMNIQMKKITVLGTGILVLGAASTTYAGGEVDTTFNSDNFGQISDSTIITNQYWPLPTSTTFVYRSIGKKGDCQVNPVQVGGTEQINGINTRVIYDKVYEDYNCTGSSDFLSEETTDWYAQDDYGNVWYFGETTQTHCPPDDETCVPSTAGSWKAGENDAEPGIVMLANPTPGDFYRQEYADDAQDMAKVLRLNADVTLTFDNLLGTDNYTGCLVTKEWSPLETGAIEHKYYCPGTGLVLINELQSGTVRTELVDITQQ